MSPSPVEEESEAEEEVMEVSEYEEEVVYEEVSEEEEEEEEQNPKQKLSVVESISHLQSLQGALSDFLSHYSALQQTLDSINSSIDAKSSNGSKSIKSIKTIKTIKTEARTDNKQFSELESICLANGAKALRKYILKRLVEIDRLRYEVPKALKLAPDPAKLVLEAMGRFYLQDSITYERGHPTAINFRRAGILLLEFYVLAGFQVVPALVQKNAMDAAVAWWSRLIREGGIESARAVDALGLTLLLASFGIPAEFRPNDLCSLLRLSNLKKKGDVLRRSPILVQKMPDIIKDLVANEKHVEAVDLICAFGLEEKFPPPSLLSSFVKNACEVELGKRREGQCSLKALKESYEKELAALKSVNKCVEDHKFNASELADLKINQKIANCEREILKTEDIWKDNYLKRQFGDVEPLKNQDNHAKHLRPSAETSGNPLVQSIRQTQEQGTAISDSRDAYNRYIANNTPLSSEASHGLVDRNGVRLLEQNAHGPAGEWHGNAFYQEPGGHNLRTPHSLGHEFGRYSAAAGQDVYYTPASGQNIYQPPASGQSANQPPASGKSAYPPPASGKSAYPPPASGKSDYRPGQNAYRPPTLGQSDYRPPALGQSDYRPPASGQSAYRPPASGQSAYRPPASGQNAYQPPVSGQNAYQPPASGQNVYQQTVPPASGQNVYQQTVPPASGQNAYRPPASGQNVYQPPASAQNFYQQTVSGQSLYQSHGSPLVAGGRNLFQFADNVFERELPIHSATSNALPTAANTVANPSHKPSYAS